MVVINYGENLQAAHEKFGIRGKICVKVILNTTHYFQKGINPF